MSPQDSINEKQKEKTAMPLEPKKSRIFEIDRVSLWFGGKPGEKVCDEEFIEPDMQRHVVEFYTLDELIKFVEKYGNILIDKSGAKIVIYGDYI